MIYFLDFCWTSYFPPCFFCCIKSTVRVYCAEHISIRMFYPDFITGIHDQTWIGFQYELAFVLTCHSFLFFMRAWLCAPDLNPCTPPGKVAAARNKQQHRPLQLPLFMLLRSVTSSYAPCLASPSVRPPVRPCAHPSVRSPGRQLACHSVRLPARSSIYPAVRPPAHWSVRLAVRPPVRPAVRQPLGPPGRLSARPSAPPSVHSVVCPSARPYVLHAAPTHRSVRPIRDDLIEDMLAPPLLPPLHNYHLA